MTSPLMRIKSSLSNMSLHISLRASPSLLALGKTLVLMVRPGTFSHFDDLTEMSIEQ